MFTTVVVAVVGFGAFSGIEYLFAGNIKLSLSEYLVDFNARFISSLRACH